MSPSKDCLIITHTAAAPPLRACVSAIGVSGRAREGDHLNSTFSQLPENDLCGPFLSKKTNYRVSVGVGFAGKALDQTCSMWMM